MKGGLMKSKKANLVARISIFLIFCGISVIWGIQVFGEALAYVPKENEELYGTWVNEEYNSSTAHARWDYNSDGTWASYSWVPAEPTWKGKYSITGKWTDKSGDVWYKITWVNEGWGTSGYGLIRIGDSGSTMESAYHMNEYPTKIDSTQSFWQYGGIHYRK
jgi:hypothetical protein